LLPPSSPGPLWPTSQSLRAKSLTGKRTRGAKLSVDLARDDKIVGMGFLLRTVLTGIALWVVTLIVPGVYFVGGQQTWQKVGIVLVVAVIFGVVNAVIKPIVQIIAIPLYILTLGLIHVVINALMLWITSWVTRNTTHWGLDIDHFWWTAIWAAIVLSLVSWALSVLVRDTPLADR
jgi:putative membrane protein